jgi:hypothetical protein
MEVEALEVAGLEAVELEVALEVLVEVAPSERLIPPLAGWAWAWLPPVPLSVV